MYTPLRLDGADPWPGRQQWQGYIKGCYSWPTVHIHKQIHEMCGP